MTITIPSREEFETSMNERYADAGLPLRHGADADRDYAEYVSEVERAADI